MVLAAAGSARISTIVAALVDTNILVYRFDARFPKKQRIATATLRDGLARHELRLPHQAIVEFVAVATRPLAGEPPLLDRAEAIREAEDLLDQFPILYPNEALVRLAMRGMAAYQLAWFDAHLWAYAEHFGLTEIISEDFEHERAYGSVRARNPFAPSPVRG
jgi:predicted nucleic acid-binding protein